MAHPGTEQLPLFPLGLVLFPGLVLPLHVFEERYRTLIRELLERPEDERRFGVVAIREGREVGEDGVRALYEVGCVARLQRAQAYPDGRFDVVTVGSERFRLHGLSSERPYLTGAVELVDETGDGDEARLRRQAVDAAWAGYREALDAVGIETDDDAPSLPADPRTASYLVAATLVLDLADRQALLEVPGTAERLAEELRLLRRETTLLGVLAAVPAPELTRTPLSLN